MTTKMTAQDVAAPPDRRWNSHDHAAFAGGYAEDAKVTDPLYAEPLCRPAAIEKDASDFMSAFPDVNFDRGSSSDGDLLVVGGHAQRHAPRSACRCLPALFRLPTSAWAFALPASRESMTRA